MGAALAHLANLSTRCISGARPSCGVSAQLSANSMSPFPDLFTDEDIAQAAMSALVWNTLVPRDRIKLEVGSGWITLEGDVDWHYQKVTAHDAVCNLRGVEGITDKIVVKPASVGNAVKAHIEAALRRRYGKNLNHIKVEARGDHVILRGTVPSLAERSEVERTAWTTPGVCNVNNNLGVKRGKP